jgi:hypothetical protein
MNEASVEEEEAGESSWANMPWGTRFPHGFAAVPAALAMRKRRPGEPLLTFP